jgi:hypothetical protein
MQYLDPPFRNAALWGVLMLAIVIGASARLGPSGASAFASLVLGLGFLAALAFALGPAIVALRVAQAIRSSAPAQARVVAIEDEGYDLVLAVSHPQGEFRATVGIPSGRRNEAAVGATFDAGVDPDQPRLLLLLARAAS